MTIRIAREGDAAAMIPLVNAAFAVETFFDGTRTDAPRMAELMATGEFLVAENARGGFAGCVYVEQRGERGYFGMLAVDPACQGSGVGRGLVAAAENWCRKRQLATVDITVLELRPELLPYYRKFGYRESHIEEFRPTTPLKSGVTCRSIVLSKSL